MSPSQASGAKPAILQIVPALDAGGVERTTIDIAQALSRDGYAPLVASAGGRLEPQLIAAGGELIRLPMASKAPHTILANAWRLRDIIRTRNVKLVHARSRAPAWSALLAARMTGVPFVTTYAGIYNASGAAKRFYNSVMVRADAVIANSQWTARHIGSEYRIKPSRLVVIHRGVDLSEFDPAGVAPDRIAASRKAWNAKEGETVILLPGRLTRWKGQTVFLDALAQMKRDGRLANVRAVIAGDAQGRGEYEAELRRRAGAGGLGDSIVFAGHIRDMPAAYLAADIVVSASTDPEAFGRVAAEAGAMAKSVIASDHGGARETVLDGVSGILTRPGDSAALAEVMARLIAAGPAARSNMGAKGRAHVAQNFTRVRMCADTLALYRSLMPK